MRSIDSLWYLPITSGMLFLGGILFFGTGSELLAETTLPGPTQTSIQESFRRRPGEEHELSPAVERLALVSSENGDEIQTLRDGDTLNINSLAARRLNIAAIVSENTSRVVFRATDSSRSRDSRTAAEELTKEGVTVFHGWTPHVGNLTLTAVPYSAHGTKGPEEITTLFIRDDPTTEAGLGAVAERSVSIRPPSGTSRSTTAVESWSEIASAAAAREALRESVALLAFAADDLLALRAPQPESLKVSADRTLELADSEDSDRDGLTRAALVQPPGDQATVPEISGSSMDVKIVTEGHAPESETSGSSRCRGFVSGTTGQLTIVCAHPFRTAESALVYRTDSDERVCEFLNVVSPMITTCAASESLIDSLTMNELVVRIKESDGPEAMHSIPIEVQ